MNRHAWPRTGIKDGVGECSPNAKSCHDNLQESALGKQFKQWLPGPAWPHQSTPLPLTDEQILWLLQRLGSPHPGDQLEQIIKGTRLLGNTCLGLLTQGRQLADEAFLELLYENLLGRTADPDGLRSYMTGLANGQSREQVVESFLLSEEFRRILPPVSLFAKFALWAGFLVRPKHPPIPPPDLISLVAGTRDVLWFLRSGTLAAGTLRETLERNGRKLENLSSVLDFGCGCGRVLRHLCGYEGVSFHGCDYNPRLVRWCKRHLRFAQFERNPSWPPLPFKDGQFDFIYAFSVFTHMTIPQQVSWMRELSRVLSEGGFLLISTHGRHYLRELNEDEQKRFEAGEIVVRGENVAGTNLCMVFHPPESVRNFLAKDYAVLDFIPVGAKGNPYQDVFLLRKP